MKINYHQWWHTGTDVKTREEANEVFIGVSYKPEAFENDKELLELGVEGWGVLYDLNSKSFLLLHGGTEVPFTLTDAEREQVTNYVESIK